MPPDLRLGRLLLWLSDEPTTYVEFRRSGAGLKSYGDDERLPTTGDASPAVLAFLYSRGEGDLSEVVDLRQILRRSFVLGKPCCGRRVADQPEVEWPQQNIGSLAGGVALIFSQELKWQSVGLETRLLRLGGNEVWPTEIEIPQV